MDPGGVGWLEPVAVEAGAAVELLFLGMLAFVWSGMLAFVWSRLAFVWWWALVKRTCFYFSLEGLALFDSGE